jgi:hypothetical protein
MLDYERPEVRSHFMGIVAEAIDRYDMDCLELDFMRNPNCFKPGHEEAGLKILTEFNREVRNMLHKAETKRGHAIKLAIRVPSTPETCLGLGMDTVTWARQGLIDTLIITPFFATADTDMPVELWRQLLEGTSVELGAGLDLNLRPDPAAPNLKFRNSIETVRGIAWSYLYRGTDFIYLFNFYDKSPEAFMADHGRYHEMLREAGSIETLRGKRRRHVVTFQDTWAPGTPAGYLLPAKLGRDSWQAFRINIGEAPKDETVHAVIGIASGNSFPDIYINTVLCEKTPCTDTAQPLPDCPLMAYKIKNDVIHSGANILEAHGADCEIVWVEINVG